MNNHTPGPWRYTGPDEFGDYTVHPPAPTELAIAAVMHLNKEANARLIAAAPELLEALEAIVFAPQPEREMEIFALHARARAAISKARGEE